MIEENNSLTFLEGLNPVQKQAVTTIEGPLMVVAGPGSGKTRVLTFRIAHLINQGIPPYNILALTFTNKAAKEMKERISKVVPNGIKGLLAGTFHSIFARILRVEADKIGFPTSFTIYDTDDSKSLIRSILKELSLSTEVYNVNTVKARISNAKSNLYTPKLYAKNEELTSQDKINNRPYTAEIYKRYMTRCKKAGAMDFDDLLLNMFLLLKNIPELRDKYQERFKYMLVDEFQDTNYLQYEIIRLLARNKNLKSNICIVGDDAQSIYGFRGATIENILNFQKDFEKENVKILKLEQNYRSTNHIVQAANEVILNNKNQIQKKIWSDVGEGNKINLISALTDGEEGKRVVDTILEQKNRQHLANKDFAILYRTNAQSRIFEEHLRRYNINYKVFGGLSFYQRKEIKDIVAYFRLVINPLDEEAIKRVINYPRRGVGKTSVEKILKYALDSDCSMWEAMHKVAFSPRTRNSINSFINMIKKFQRALEEVNAFEIANQIIRESGIYDKLKLDSTIEGMSRQENVNALIDGISEFVDSRDEPKGEPESNLKNGLADYLENIALLTDFDNEIDDDNFVTLMSIHSAKGLEFPSVFVVGLEEKLFPSFMALDSEKGIEEERRLFYVAITRAERFLTLSFSKGRYRFGKMINNNQSRFLSEIDLSHFEQIYNKRLKNYDKSAGNTPRSSVSGNFKKKVTQPKIDLSGFKPSPSEDILEGKQVLHAKFGKGKVLKLDGGGAKKVATIRFENIENPERRLMLKFAKLQVLD